MSAVERDFSTYQRGDDVYELANGIIPEIAEAAHFDLAPEATETSLGELIGRVGPDKELQQNISVVRQALGSDARDQIADWVERSGIMAPLDRGFVKNEVAPDHTDAIVFTGGVANWIIRRAVTTLRLDPAGVDLFIPMGNRQMKPVEHQLVVNYEREHEALPTEAEFAEWFLADLLEDAGFTPEFISVDDSRGDKVMDALFAQRPELFERSVRVVSNTPNAIQATGEFRLAGIRADVDFDYDGSQVTMFSDGFPLARNGEKPAVAQNPETALGQLVRNALYLVRNDI